MSAQSALADAALQLLGRPFRLHGRDPATGLDCIGLVAAALTMIGAKPAAPAGYALRNISIDQWLGHATQSGLVASPGAIRAGDILLIGMGHCQHHLAIATGSGMVVHAHASLRQVVHQPLEPDWHIRIKWRAAHLREV